MTDSVQFTPPESVCIVRLSAIGDICHTLAVVRVLQDAWPETRFSWIIDSVACQLIGGIADIEFIVFDKARGLSAMRSLRRRLGQRHFPLLLHMHPSTRANIVSLQVEADIRLGFDRDRAKDLQWLVTNDRIAARPKQHVMEGLFGFAEHFGVMCDNLRWDIPINRSNREFAIRSLAGSARTLTISPCSQMSYRNWDVDGYVAVADYAASRFNAQIILTGGNTPIERKYGERITAKCSCQPLNLIGRTSLGELLALLDQTDVLLCPDSGPAHMATAVRTPVIGLYAATNPDRARPYLSRNLVVDKYPQAIRKQFNKSVGDVRWGTRVRQKGTMQLIRVSDVTQKIDQLFA